MRRDWDRQMHTGVARTENDKIFREGIQDR